MTTNGPPPINWKDLYAQGLPQQFLETESAVPAYFRSADRGEGGQTYQFQDGHRIEWVGGPRWYYVFPDGSNLPFGFPLILCGASIWSYRGQVYCALAEGHDGPHWWML